MSSSHVGRVIGGRIELDDELSALEGKTVRVTVEVVPVEEEEEHPAIRATREALPDDRPSSEEERAAVEEGRRGPFISTAELRARLAAHHAKRA
jgi:hypothetical protein